MQRNVRSNFSLLNLVSYSAFSSEAQENWPQPAGPNKNWQVEGEPPTQWSVTRNQNIRWRTPMPEAGMSNVTVWGDKVFVTAHVPIKELKENRASPISLAFASTRNRVESNGRSSCPGLLSFPLREDSPTERSSPQSPTASMSGF